MCWHDTDVSPNWLISPKCRQPSRRDDRVACILVIACVTPCTADDAHGVIELLGYHRQEQLVTDPDLDG